MRETPLKLQVWSGHWVSILPTVIGEGGGGGGEQASCLVVKQAVEFPQVATGLLPARG